MQKENLSKKIRWGMIGCGDVAERKSGPAFYSLPHTSFEAVMCRSFDKVTDYARRHGVSSYYTDADLLINDSKVDAVYVATPPSSHVQYTISALHKGKPVYVEKPMATTYADALAMQELSERLDVPLFVALYRRRLDYFLKVKELIDSGTVGEVREVQLEFIQKPNEADKSGQKNWRIDPSISGGGYFVDLAPHQLDLVLLYLGAVQSFEANVENRGGWYDVEDYVDLTMTMKQGAKVKGLWDFSSVDAEEKDRFVIIGTKGSIHFSTFSMTPIRLKIGDKEEVFDIEKPAVIQTPMISYVSNLLLQGKDDRQALADAVEGMRIIESVLS